MTARRASWSISRRRSNSSWSAGVLWSHGAGLGMHLRYLRAEVDGERIYSELLNLP